MGAHAGNTWINGARDALSSAKVLKANTANHQHIYYYAGHSVELMLVGFRLRRNSQLIVPASEKGGKWHDLGFLLDKSGEKAAMLFDCGKSKALLTNWLVVVDWQSNDRFPGASVNKKRATEMLTCVSNPTNGVYKWLLNHYQTN